MKLRDIPHNDLAQIDHFAWQAIKNWPAVAGLDPVRDGLDFGILIRRFLWERVGRAIRAEIDPIGFEFEQKLFFQFDRYRPLKRMERWRRSLKNLKSAVLHSTMGTILCKTDLPPADTLDKSNPKGEPAILIPHPSPRLGSLAAALLERGHSLVVFPATVFPGFSGAANCPNFAPSSTDLTFVKQLHDAVLEGLSKLGIKLQLFDQSSLREELERTHRRLAKATIVIDKIAPKAVLVHGDNHSPYQEYVAVAKRDGISSIAFQHGLDCERYYLDDSYCSALAVWSEHRKQRYEKDSECVPPLLKVTGNPAFDWVTTLPEKIDPHGDYVLWITRPHTSSFCYSPSRQPREGFAILDALLDALANNHRMNLLIKPHPQDYDNLYAGRINERGMSERANVVKQDLKSLIANAKVVITEDSTGGLDAMLQGKILVHAHFAKSEPVLPFCQYTAALPGFSDQQLTESLNTSLQLTTAELEEMHAGQHRFIKDFAGELDGMSETRMVAFCEKVLA